MCVPHSGNAVRKAAEIRVAASAAAKTKTHSIRRTAYRTDIIPSRFIEQSSYAKASRFKYDTMITIGFHEFEAEGSVILRRNIYKSHSLQFYSFLSPFQKPFMIRKINNLLSYTKKKIIFELFRINGEVKSFKTFLVFPKT